MTFGEKLRKIRKDKGVSQLALSKISGIHQPVLSWYENDKVRPTVDSLEWLCTALKITASELLGF